MTTGGAVQTDWLGTFLAIAEHAGVRAASHVLHLSQSRVSAHLAALERVVGVRLVERGARGTTLTVQGEAFRAHARLAVAELDRGVRAAREASTRPVARIGVCAPVPHLLRSLVWPAMEAFPEPLFVPLAGEAEAALQAGTIDAAIAPAVLLDAWAEQTPLGVEDVVALGPPHAGRVWVLEQDLPALRAAGVDLGPDPKPVLDLALGVALAHAGHGSVVGLRDAVSAAAGPGAGIRTVGQLAFVLAWSAPAPAWLSDLMWETRVSSVPKRGTGDPTSALSCEPVWA